MTLFTTPPLPIVDRGSDMRHRGGVRKEPIQFIVLHHTGAWPALDWLTVNQGSSVSSHRYVEPEKPIYKLVDDMNVAYTQGFADVGPWTDAGSRNFNQVCLSIEGCYDPYRDVRWSLDVVWKMACQCVEWMGLYGMLPIVYHSQIDSRKNDPLHFPRPDFDRFVMILAGRAMAGTLSYWLKPLELARVGQ